MTARCALYMYVGAIKNFERPRVRPRLLLPKFLMGFCSDRSYDRATNVRTTFEVRSFTRSWDNRGYSKNLGSPSIRPRTLQFLPNFKGLLFGRTLWMNTRAKFEDRSFTCSWDNRGYSKHLGRPWIRPSSFYLQNFSLAYVRMDPLNVSAKFAVRSFRPSRSWDNSDCSFGVG